MSGSVNKATLVGNLGADPEIRTMNSGDRVASFSLATSESWKDKATGEKKERTQWHRVVVWNQGLVTITERYLKKGMKIYLEGQIETRKYQAQDGSDRYATEIVLRPFNGEITMLSSSGAGKGPPPPGEDDYRAGPAPAAAATSVDTLADEIPF